MHPRALRKAIISNLTAIELFEEIAHAFHVVGEDGKRGEFAQVAEFAATAAGLSAELAHCQFEQFFLLLGRQYDEVWIRDVGVELFG